MHNPTEQEGNVATQGMEEVEAAETAITWIDGRRGELRYRGYAVGELAEQSSYENVAYLLWHGDLATVQQGEALRRQLRGARVDADWVLDRVGEAPAGAHPLDVLRYAVSWDALTNPLTLRNEADANLAKARDMTAWFIVAAAAFHRVRAGLEPVPPRPDLDTAANFLFMLRGEEADETTVKALDTSLILHADHELNASTFSARVTIATQSNLHAAVASALGTLAGPRHGGASERVIMMLEEIGSADRVQSWVQDELAAQRRVMGFGHRVYRTVDPRSKTLRRMAEAMLAQSDHAEWTDILRELAVVMERERTLYPNVDLYAAVVNHELGIDPAFYTSVFACSRIAGWTAHAIEQLDGRMIRPAARYTGPEPRSIPVLDNVMAEG